MSKFLDVLKTIWSCYLLSFAKTVLTGLYGILKKFDYKDWIILLFGILCLCLLIACRHYRNQSQEVIILNDSLSIYKNKLGEEYVAKDTYVLTEKQLKEYNKQLYDEVQSLKDNPIVVTKTNTVFYKDTIHAKSDTILIASVGDTTLYKLKWSAADSSDYYSMKGTTSVVKDFSDFKTVVTDLKVKNQTSLDLIDDGKQLKVIAKNDNPYISVDSIQSVVIDPTKSKTLKKYFKQKHWGVGPYVGVGVDVRQGVVDPQVGIGVTYSIFNF